MQEDNLVAYKNPGMALPVADALTEVLRRGAGHCYNTHIVVHHHRVILQLPRGLANIAALRESLNGRPAI